MAASEDLKDLDITSDELDRLQKAMKDEKFRKMFVEYAEEISNPENRKKYEEEIAELERNRGMDVKFINPEPGFVIKTSVDGEKKAFVNFAQNRNVNEPKSQIARQNGKQGFQWTIPHSVSPSREDLDKAGNKCSVFDCVFHPECFKVADGNPQFEQLIKDTAFNAIEREYGVKLDRNNMRQMKNMKYKGRSATTVIRTVTSTANGSAPKEDGVSALNLPYPYDSTDVNSNNKSSSPNHEKKTHSVTHGIDDNNPEDGKFTVPQYTITHRGHFDLQQFTNAPDSRTSTRPHELVIKIALPLLKSASGIKLDIFERRLYLESTKAAIYQLDLKLPFPVNENDGSAKFDKSKCSMVVILPVLPPDTPPLPSFTSCMNEVEEVDHKADENKQPNGESTLNVNAAKHRCNQDNDDGIQEMAKLTWTDDSTKHAIQSNAEICDAVGDNNDVSVDVNEYTCPEFSFHQNGNSVSIIVEARSAVNIKNKLSEDGGHCWLEVETSHKETFGLQLMFHEGSSVSDITYDASSDNVVFILHKASTSLGEWQSFMAGTSRNSLQLKKFTTRSNVESVQLSGESCAEESAQRELISAKVVSGSEENDKLVIKVEIGPKAVTGGLPDIKKEPRQNGATPSSDEPGPISSIGSSSGNVCDEDKSPQGSALLHDAGSKSHESVNESGLSGVMRSDSDQGAVQQGSDSTSTDSPGCMCSVDRKPVEAELSIDVNGSDVSESTSSPSIKSPLSPNSLLKSSFRSKRTRSSKSVSFSDEVVVGIFTPARGKKGRKKSPYIRRSTARLKAPAQEVCSDSELLLSYQDTDDSEEDLWDILPPRRAALHRQSSTESESDALGSPRGKNKKSKGSRQRRKERARRALMSESSAEEGENGSIQREDNVVENGARMKKLDWWPREDYEKNDDVSCKQDTQEGVTGQSPKDAEPSSTESAQEVSGGDGGKGDSKDHGRQESNESMGDDLGSDEADGEGDEGWTTVTSKRHHRSERVSESEGTCSMGDDGGVDGGVTLDAMDHHTKSSVNFSNEVMFDLDD